MTERSQLDVGEKLGLKGQTNRSNPTAGPHFWAARLHLDQAYYCILLHTELTRMKNDDKLTTLVFAQFCGFGIRFDMKI